MLSVILPVYNGEAFIEESTQSILNQSYKDFELIIIDDGSSDNTLNILKKIKDKRVVLIEQKNNLGIAETLNNGLKASKYDLIARMDADDISLPNRFEEQLKVMKNDKIVLCGTSALRIYDFEEKIGSVFTSNKQIKSALLIKNQFYHSSIMMQKTDLLYDKEFEKIEDYHYWIKMLNYGDFHNLSQALIKYRVRENSHGKNRTEHEVETYLIKFKNIVSLIYEHLAYEKPTDLDYIIHFINAHLDTISRVKLNGLDVVSYYEKINNLNPYSKEVFEKIMVNIFKTNYNIHKDNYYLNTKYFKDLK